MEVGTQSVRLSGVWISSRRDSFDSMQLVSHRCLGFESSENSVRGLVSGMRSAVDQIEVDLRLTSDNVFVALHLPYYFTRKGRLHLISRRTVRDAGKDNLPTLNEILDTFQAEGATKLLRLEVKVPGREMELIEELRRRNLLQSVVIASWSLRILERLREADREVRLCYSFIEGYPCPGRVRSIVSTRVNLDSLCIIPTISRFVPRFISRYLIEGVQLFVVGSPSPQQYAELEAAGVSGILTKTPAVYSGVGDSRSSGPC